MVLVWVHHDDYDVCGVVFETVLDSNFVAVDLAPVVSDTVAHTAHSHNYSEMSVYHSPVVGSPPVAQNLADHHAAKVLHLAPIYRKSLNLNYDKKLLRITCTANIATNVAKNTFIFLLIFFCY